MEIEALAGMIFTLILIAMIGGFVLMIPISRRLGMLLEVWVEEKKGVAGADEIALLRRSIHQLEQQVGELTERQQFTDRLLEGRSEEAVAAEGRGSGRG